MRADVFLVDFGHATTRSQAQRLIAAGVEWRLSPLAPWQKVAKNGDDIPSVAEVRLLDDAEAKYISRGGLKLEGALRATGLSVTGLRCLDVGQSTGGFTDCLLQHGAAQVIGVDVGHGQHDDQRRDQDKADEQDLAVHAVVPATAFATGSGPSSEREKRRRAGSRHMAVPAVMMKTPIQIQTTAGVTMARIPMLPSVPTFIRER